MAIGRVPGATGIQPSIVDAKGDLIAATAADSVSRLAVGTNNQVLTADSAEATGLKYANEARATLTTTGDILYASAANTPARLGIGSTDQVLKVSGGIPAWGAAPSPSFVGFSGNLASTTSTANGVETVLNFNETIDTNGFHSDVTNASRVTIPTGYGGKYLLVAVMRYADNATGYRGIYFRKNGSAAPLIFVPTGSGFATVVAGSSLQTAVATDYFEIAARQGSGGNLNVEADTIFSVIYLGA